ncbi:MAG: serine/threonine-protein kinase [Actinomycetes bacterium]
MSELVGRRIGPYELTDVIRRRRTSTAYRSVVDGRPLAVTVLPQETDPSRLAALIGEARAVARLRHPHIVPLVDAGADQGRVYVVEEYAGERATLADRAPGPGDPVEVVGLVSPLLAALAHAHEHGVVHRDLGPRHIVLPSPMWPLLADFAIGRDLPVGPGGARPVVGDPAYLAPEQAFGLPAGPPADLYAVVVVLYELLTGTVPFHAATPDAVLRSQAYEPPPPPRAVRADLSRELEGVLLRGLAKNPEHRHASALELADELWSATSTSAVTHDAEIPASPPVAVAESEPLADLYAAGVRAFAEQRLDEARDLLGQVADADPTYEDVLDLLEAATADRDGG